MPVVHFTPAFMATGLVCPPDKKKIEYSVADGPGLFVECRSSASSVPPCVRIVVAPIEAKTWGRR